MATTTATRDPAQGGTEVVLITGASDGIGAELARQWAARRRGGPRRLQLVLAARRRDRLEAVAAACRDGGAAVDVEVVDVAEREQVEALVRATVERHRRLDTLVHNAGVSGHALLAEVAPADLGWYEQMMRVNLWAAVWGTHAALPALAASRGQVVAVSSLAGLVGVPGRTAYSASKFALAGFCEALRAEVADDGIAVTVVYPGIVDTETRRNGFDASGGRAGIGRLREDRMMPVDVCARQMLDGIDARRREVVMTVQGRLGRWLKLLAPGRVDALAWQAVKPEFRLRHPR